MARAVASHILVDTEAQAVDLKRQAESGITFADLAKEHSKCPSGQQGGTLGEFGPGEMVSEFDQIVFGDLPVGMVSSPIKTQFGYHLIVIEKRIP